MLALNRHHTQRIKARRRKYLICWNPQDPRLVGKLEATPRPCSHLTCRNERYNRAKERGVELETKGGTGKSTVLLG